MGKICRNIRAQWDSEALSNALKAVQRGLSQRKAAERYGIPRRTIRNHLKSGKVEKNWGGNQFLLPNKKKISWPEF